MTLQNNDKNDDLITGWRARWYSISSTILGLSLVRRKALLALSLKNGENLLDIGCGSGDFLERIHERYGDDVILFGVDGSPDMIEEARRRTKGMDIAFMVAQAQELPFPSETFDSVVSTLVFHHISPKGKRTAIKEICRVLKVGGRCVITDFGCGRNWLGKFFAFLSSGHGYTKGNTELILTELSKRGFTVEHKGLAFGWIETLVATTDPH